MTEQRVKRVNGEKKRAFVETDIGYFKESIMLTISERK